MRNTICHKVSLAVIAFACLATCSLWAQQPATKRAAKAAAKPEEHTLAHDIRHQLQVLPYYSVFDFIAFTVESGKVTLSGQVVRPTLRTDAEAAVRSIEGVGSVNNLIEVLPKSFSDDELRRGVYRAIFEDEVLQRYAVSELPAIHILVKEGAVALKGVVASEGDKNLAGARASGVS